MFNRICQLSDSKYDPSTKLLPPQQRFNTEFLHVTLLNLWDLSSLLFISLTAAATRGGDPRLMGLFLRSLISSADWSWRGNVPHVNGEETGKDKTTQNQPAYGEEILLFVGGGINTKWRQHIKALWVCSFSVWVYSWVCTGSAQGGR